MSRFKLQYKINIILFSLLLCLFGSNLNGQTPVFDAMDIGSGFIAYPPSPGLLGSQEYTVDPVINPNASFMLQDFRFVGGVDVANGVIQVDFFDSANLFVDGFTVSLPASGNFIWTINLGPNSGLVLPSSGRIEITNITPGYAGQWFLSDKINAMHIGTSGATFPDPGGGLGLGYTAALDRFDPPPEPVPTLGQWGLLILGLSLLILGTVYLSTSYNKQLHES